MKILTDRVSRGEISAHFLNEVLGLAVRIGALSNLCDVMMSNEKLSRTNPKTATARFSKYGNAIARHLILLGDGQVGGVSVHSGR